MKTIATSLSLVALLLLGPGAARAQDPLVPAPVPAEGAMPAAAPGGDAFGQQGQIVLDAKLSGGLGLVVPSKGDSGFSLVLQPSLLYFVTPEIAVGGTVGLAYAKQGETSGTTFLLGPTAAYHVPLSDKMSLLPGIFVAFETTSVEQGPAEASQSQFGLGASVPLLFHLAPHFFVGAGLSLGYTFVNSREAGNVEMDGPKFFELGLGLFIGGWI